MGRIKNPIDLSEVKQGVLIELKKTNNTFNRQLAKKYKCDKNTIRNVLKRPGQVEKENLDPLSSEARSQSGRHLAFNEQLHRRPVRHTTKSWAQRRKPWVHSTQPFPMKHHYAALPKPPESKSPVLANSITFLQCDNGKHVVLRMGRIPCGLSISLLMAPPIVSLHCPVGIGSTRIEGSPSGIVIR